jgi:RNA polymerase sigma-70 factor (sigma-E family)
LPAVAQPLLQSVGMTSFEGWVAAAGPRLVRSAYLLMGDQGLAEDLVQHACLATWPRFETVRDPDAYAREVMVRTATSWWRRKWRGEVPHADVPEVVASSDDLDRRIELAQALRRLTPKQRAIVVLRFYEDLPEAEVAAALRLPIGTVRSTTSRALAALRRSDELTREVGS